MKKRGDGHDQTAQGRFASPESRRQPNAHRFELESEWLAGQDSLTGATLVNNRSPVNT